MNIVNGLINFAVDYKYIAQRRVINYYGENNNRVSSISFSTHPSNSSLNLFFLFRF